MIYFLVNIRWLTRNERGDGVDERADDVLKPVLERLPGVVAGWLRRSPRATQLARDLAMVARGVVGERRPVVRGSGASDSAGAGLPGERRLRVLGVRAETADAVSLELERPEGLGYEAGQFLTLVLSVGGQELRRSYSLSSTPLDEGPLVITVKRVEGGAGSSWIHAEARAGHTLRVRGPSGAFTYHAKDAPGRLVLVGGGSGITPLMGILRTALRSTPDVPVALLYANRSPADVIFRDELGRLELEYPRLTVTHVLERPGDELAGHEGRVTREHLAAALGAEPGQARVYLCGPAPMMAEVEAMLGELGLPPERLRQERFSTTRAVAEESGGRRLYRLRVGSREVEAPSDRTLLESANEGQIVLDFSCTMGGCGSCKARLVEGDVVLDEPNCLSPDERAEGLILTCSARPRSDVVIERLQ